MYIYCMYMYMSYTCRAHFYLLLCGQLVLVLVMMDVKLLTFSLRSLPLLASSCIEMNVLYSLNVCLGSPFTSDSV